MSSLSRRDALWLGGATVAGGLAGCLGAGQQSSTTPQVGGIEVVNYTPRHQAFHVMLVDGDEPIYWKTKELPAAPDGDYRNAQCEDVPTEPGNYVLHVRANRQPKSQWKDFDCGEHDVSCLDFTLTIGDLDSTEVAIWYSKDDSNCDRP